MRPRAVLASLAMLALAASAGCDGWGARWLADRFPRQHARPVPALVWQEVEPAALVVNNDAALHAVRFSIHLPASAETTTPLPPVVALEMAFNDPLDGAKVDASATGPHHTVALLDHKRFAGDSLATPLPPLPLTDVEVVVHNHLRPPPVIRSVRIGRPLATAPASTAAAIATGAKP